MACLAKRRYPQSKCSHGFWQCLPTAGFNRKTSAAGLWSIPFITSSRHRIMAAPFIIPKKKQPTQCDSMLMQSPLSRLQDSTDIFKAHLQHSKQKELERCSVKGKQSNGVTQSTPSFRDVVKARLGLGHPIKGTANVSTNYRQQGPTKSESHPANSRPDSLVKSKWSGQQGTSTPSQQAVNGTARKLTQESLSHKPGNFKSRHGVGQKTSPSPPFSFSNGRPKRASDRLFQDENLRTDRPSPPQEKSTRREPRDSEESLPRDSLEWEESSSPERTVSPRRTAGRPGTASLRDPRRRKADPGGSRATLGKGPESSALALRSSPASLRNGSKTDTSGSSPLLTSDEEPCAPRRSPTLKDTAVPRASSSSSTSAAPATPRRRLSINRTSCVNHREGLKEANEREERLKEKGFGSARLSLHLRLRKPRTTSTEPIVVSSEEEEDQAGREGLTSQSPRPRDQRRDRRSPGDQHTPTQAGADCGPGEQSELSATTTTTTRSSSSRAQPPPPPPPSVMELSFLTLHAGTVPAPANGNITVTENCIMVPLKDPDPEYESGPGLSLSLAASELRGYGVWDGALAQDGALLGGWQGPAPSLLFLWLSQALANLVQMELSPLQPVTHTGESCPFLILVLAEQLSDLQSALLASRLESGAFGQGAGCSPLPWSEGLALVHSCPQEAHLLSLLGHDASAPGAAGGGAAGGGLQGGSTRSSDGTEAGVKSREAYASSSRRQGLPSRLIRYPLAPCKGRIAVTTEDLACLESGEFLNDVIIDFYLKFLLLERAHTDMADRCHIFSSFFYKQLTGRHTPGEPLSVIPARERRHQRVKTWTRNVDIFTKDFLFVPVNHEAHWYLVVICFPRLVKAQYEEWSSPASAEPRGAKRKLQPLASEDVEAEKPCDTLTEGTAGARGKPALSKRRSHSPPECTQAGCQRETVCRRPCILVMDSLKLSHHHDIYKLLREYLQVEWKVRRGTPRPFTPDTVLGIHCRVPLQDNSSDCGLYLLQYVECFLQNPVVHFDLPLRLESWFLRQRVWRKREEIKSLIMQMHQNQQFAESTNR